MIIDYRCLHLWVSSLILLAGVHLLSKQSLLFLGRPSCCLTASVVIAICGVLSLGIFAGTRRRVAHLHPLPPPL